MLVLSGDPVMELFEVSSRTSFKSGLRISHTVLLHRPGVCRTEVEQVPGFRVFTRGLQNVPIVDIWMSLHDSDHILKTLVVVLELVNPKHVLQSIFVIKL